MSTWSDSKIRRARKHKFCGICKCDINVGDEYLDYRWGQRAGSTYHVACATARGYGCRALDERKAADDAAKPAP